MKLNFKYITDEDIKGLVNFPLALELLSRERILVDSDLLPVIELAERGEFMAWFETQEAFASGACGAPKHYGLARRYTDLIMEFNRGEAVAELEGFRNSAKLELGVGNFDTAKKDLLQAVKIMANNLPVEQWDFRVFEMIRHLESQTPD